MNLRRALGGVMFWEGEPGHARRRAARGDRDRLGRANGAAAMMKFYVAGFLGCLSVAACAPAIPIPMPMPKAPPKTATEVVAAAATPRDGAGAIVFFRDNRLWGKGCTYEISIDDEVVAALRTGEQVTIYADPGRRILGVSIRSEGSCDPALAQLPLEVVAHATTRIKVGADVSYALKIEATTY